MTRLLNALLKAAAAVEAAQQRLVSRRKAMLQLTGALTVTGTANAQLRAGIEPPAQALVDAERSYAQALAVETPPAPTAAPAPVLAQSRPPVSASAPASARAGPIATMVLTPGSTGMHPFAFAHAFRKGDLPRGRLLAGLQTTVKSTWPDGSARIALIAGSAPMLGTTPHAVPLAAGAPLNGPALTTADLMVRLNDPVAIDAGAFGGAAWGGVDWNSPFMTWVSGPAMSSWIYRKPVGRDAHLVGWLEVRLWAGGAVEVLPWIENGHLLVAAPGERAGTYVFTLDGTTRFSGAIALRNHQRTPLVSGAALSHWLGADPGIVGKHDATYLMASKLVPNYVATVPDGAPAMRALPGTFAPLQQGRFPAAMGSAGYDPSIGLLPEWDALYLSNGSPATWAAVQRQAYSAGRYGIHFRDETAGRFRPVRFSQHPRLVIHGSSAVVGIGGSSNNTMTPAASGGGPPAFASSHQPSMGYLAYLLTGRFYHLETTQFLAAINYLKNSDVTRRQSEGLILTAAGANTVRGAAWALRTLAQAVAATPDDDVLAGEFRSSMNGNVSWYHAVFVAQPNNPQGMVAPYADYAPADPQVFAIGTFQQDFFTAALGYGLSLDLGGIDAAKFAALFAWKARSVVGRFGGTGPTEYLYRDAAPYVIAYSPVKAPDWAGGTGPWFADWGQIYAFVGAPARKEEGDLRGGYFPAGASYWGNLHGALAYAVDHGVPGAEEAWRRLTTARNYGALLASFNVDCVWAVGRSAAAARGPATAVLLPLPAAGATPAPSPPAPAPAPSPASSPTPSPAPEPSPEPAAAPDTFSSAWRRGMAVGEWKELASANWQSVGPPGLLDAWCGFAAIDLKVYAPGLGGHLDGWDNGCRMLDLRSDSPAWTLLSAGTPRALAVHNVSYYPDGRPTSAHTYYALAGDAARGKVFRVGTAAAFGNGNYGDARMNAWDVVKMDWDKAGTWPDGPAGSTIGASMCQDASTGDLYVLRQRLYKWTTATATWSSLALLPAGKTDQTYYRGSGYDTKRNRIVVLGDAYRPNVGYLVWDKASDEWVQATYQGSAADIAAVRSQSGNAVHYDAALDRYLVKTAYGGQVLQVHPATFAVTAFPTTGTALPSFANGVWQRFVHIPSLKGYLGVPSGSSSAYFLATG